MTIIGEEWRQLDEASRHYDPSTFSKEISAAQDQIRQIRMSEVTLKVVDYEGKPLAGLPLQIDMTRSSFPWGDQQWGLSTMNRFGFGETDRVRHYTRRFVECLNAANCLTYWTERFQNDGPKHEEFQGESKLDEFAWQVDWAQKNGLLVKGHPLMWMVPKAIPDWVKRYPYETQLVFMEARVRSTVARFKGRIKIWDAVNEPMWETSLKNLASRHWPHMESLDEILGYIQPTLRWAREEDPDACYVINDYGMEVDPPGRDLRALDGSQVNAKRQRDRFKELFRALRDRGTPADALGMQAHTGGWLQPSEQRAILDDFAEAGVPLHYTEFWAGTDHLQKAGLAPDVCAAMHAEYVANIMTMAYAHPNVEAFFFWGEITGGMGLVKGDHNSGGIPSSGNNPTPTYYRVQKLLRETWWTKDRVVTDQDGKATLRCFHGEHSARYNLGTGSTAGTPFSVTPNPNGPITIRIHRPRG